MSLIAEVGRVSLLLSLAACEGKVIDSRGLEAEDLQASFRVVERDGLAIASASFRLGDESTPIVQLVGGDEAWGEYDGERIEFVEAWTDAEWPLYEGELLIGEGHERVDFGLDLGGTPTEGSTVFVPPVFSLTSPPPMTEFRAADGITIAWATEAVDADTWGAKVEGSCVDDIIFLFPFSGMKTGPLEPEGDSETCEVTITISRSLHEGVHAPSFLDSSTERGTRERTVTVLANTEP